MENKRFDKMSPEELLEAFKANISNTARGVQEAVLTPEQLGEVEEKFPILKELEEAETVEPECDAQLARAIKIISKGW